MGRMFVAVVPEGLEKPLRPLMSKLKRTMEARRQEVRWTKPDLYHITLHFLGEVRDVDALRARLLTWRAPRDLKLRLHGLGAFPASEEARVLWIGVQASQALLDLQANLAQHLRDFPAGVEEFKPHLTLARFRNRIHAGDLIELGGRKHLGDYKIRELILFESVLQGNIIKYVPQLRVPLASNDSDSARSE